MATEVVNSYNIYVDTERYLNNTSDGDSIMLSLNQTPITVWGQPVYSTHSSIL